MGLNHKPKYKILSQGKLSVKCMLKYLWSGLKCLVNTHTDTSNMQIYLAIHTGRSIEGNPRLHQHQLDFQFHSQLDTIKNNITLTRYENFQWYFSTNSIKQTLHHQLFF